MKTLLGYILGLGLVVASLSGCGGSTTATQASTAACVAGQTQTSQGCLSQGSCQYGYLQESNGQCALATSIASTNTCTTAGQVSTQSNGCVTSTGSCQTNGTQGVYANGTGVCYPLSTTGSASGLINQCQLYTTDGTNTCLTVSPNCNYSYGYGMNASQQCVQGSPRPICTAGLGLQELNNGQYACLSNNQNGFGNGFGGLNNGGYIGGMPPGFIYQQQGGVNCHSFWSGIGYVCSR